MVHREALTLRVEEQGGGLLGWKRGWEEGRNSGGEQCPHRRPRKASEVRGQRARKAGRAQAGEGAGARLCYTPRATGEILNFI